MNDSQPMMAITGATGFLGSRIVPLALSLGWRLRIITRAQQDAHSPLTEIVACGYDDVDKLRRAFSGVDVVLHCSGLAHVTGPRADEEHAFFKANAEAAGNAALAARDAAVRHFILVSSVSVYGTYDGLVVDEHTSCRPNGCYARSKLAGEQQASANLAGSCTALTILRMATLYGEGDRGNVAGLLRGIAGGCFVLPGSGRNKKSLLYVGDAARACIAVAGAAVIAGRQSIYNVSATPRSMSDIVGAASALFHCNVRWLPLPSGLLAAVASTLHRLRVFKKAGLSLRTFVRDDVYSADVFDATFGFRCITELAEGLLLQAEADPELLDHFVSLSLPRLLL